MSKGCPKKKDPWVWRRHIARPTWRVRTTCLFGAGVSSPRYAFENATQAPAFLVSNYHLLALLGTMNSLQDPNKKTSITSLLNPDVATGYPHNRAIATHSIPHAMHQRPALTAQGTTLAHSTPPYSERTSFRLTSASWSGGVTHSDVHHHSGGNGYSSDRRDDSGYASVVSTVVVDQGTSQYNPHGRHRATSIHSMTGLEPGHAWQPSPEASSSGVSRPGEHLSFGTTDQRNS